nr:2C [Rhinovirus C]
GDGWLKKFTECCNAAKGLEWIGIKISKFIEWLKNRLLPTLQHKKEILDECKKIDLYQEQVKGFSKVDEPAQQELLIKVEKLKKGLDSLAPLYAVENKRVTNIYKELKALSAYKTTQRTEPVCILIRGAPGCGKSLVTSIIARGLTKPGDIYSLPPDPKHFDGYDQQEVVIMDDLGQNPDGKDLSMFCQMVSTTNFIPPMAALEDKGKTFTSKYILASTNLLNLQPPTVTVPEAIDRRFYLDLDLKILQGYQNQVGLLDTAKALQPCANCSKPPHYKQCCPLLCGKAVVLVNRRTKGSYAINMVVQQLIEESKSRKSVGNNLTAIFQ